MGNIIESFFTGLIHSISKLFGSPLDFLSGKSCSSVCGPTWDFICYIEHFCVANLLRIAIVLMLSYIVLLFLYMLYKVGMCRCIGHGLCKMLWACISCWFSFWEYCCTFLCGKLLNPSQKRHSYISEDMPKSQRWRDYRRDRLRKSLRPRSHRVRVRISRDSVYGHKRNHIKHAHQMNPVHGIRVTRTSKFVHKGLKYGQGIHHSNRRS